MYRPPKQDKYSRYARYAMKQPIVWLGIMAMAVAHFPKGLRQYAADRIMLRVVEMEYGKC